MVNIKDITQLKNNRLMCTELILIQLHRETITQFLRERALAHQHMNCVNSSASLTTYGYYKTHKK